MYKTFLNLTLVCSLLGLNNAFSSPENIVPLKVKPGSIYVDVQLNTNKTAISFKRCLHLIENSCEQIGPANFYSIEKLKKQRMVELTQVGGAVVADVVIVLAAALGGWTIAAAGSGVIGTILAAPIGLASGSAVGAAVVSSIDVVNPSLQYKQSSIISPAVLEDETVETDSIYEFIQNLETVLEKM